MSQNKQPHEREAQGKRCCNCGKKLKVRFGELTKGGHVSIYCACKKWRMTND